MDPEEALRMLRVNARIINTLAQIDDISDAQRNEILDNATAMAETFANLDQWLSTNGFIPRDWQTQIIRNLDRDGRVISRAAQTRSEG